MIRGNTMHRRINYPSLLAVKSQEIRLDMAELNTAIKKIRFSFLVRNKLMPPQNIEDLFLMCLEIKRFFGLNSPE